MEDQNQGCMRRGHGLRKRASGITVYLIEELGDARMRCVQLKNYVAEAIKLVEKSEHRDHFFEVAAHLIHGIPDAVFKLEKSLQAAAMSAAKMDFEEIKQDLQPEKAEQLEQVLDDVRMRLLQRRSNEGEEKMNPKTAAQEILRIADISEATGRVPMSDLLNLVASLERGHKEASGSSADKLRVIAGTMTGATNSPSRISLARSLRSFIADAIQPVTRQLVADNTLLQANSREEVMKGFKKSNPDLTDTQLEEIADQWEKNKDVVKDKHAAEQQEQAQTEEQKTAVAAPIPPNDAAWFAPSTSALNV